MWREPCCIHKNDTRKIVFPARQKSNKNAAPALVLEAV